jgi:hypothetical protein
LPPTVTVALKEQLTPFGTGAVGENMVVTVDPATLPVSVPVLPFNEFDCTALEV